MFVCPSNCCRVHQCLSMLGPLPTSPMATPRCWQTSWLWSWLDGTASWVRARSPHSQITCASRVYAQPQNLCGWQTTRCSLQSLGAPHVEEFKLPQQDRLNFNLLFTPELQPAPLLLQPLACIHLSSDSLSALPASGWLVCCFGVLLLRNFLGNWKDCVKKHRREEGSWLIILRAFGML